MKKKQIGVFLLMVMLSLAFILIAEKPQVTKLNYSIYGDKVKMGSIKTVNERSVTAAGTVKHIESSWKISLGKAISIKGRVDVVIDDKGLLSYASETTTNDQSVKITGSRSGEQIALSIKGSGIDFAFLLQRKDYDFSSLEDVHCLIKRGEIKILRILDLEVLKVVTWKLSYLRDEKLEFKGEKVPCMVIEFESDKSNGRRWLTLDDQAMLLKEVGTNQDGPYTVLLTKWKTKGK